MKRIILVSMCILGTSVMNSCTTDDPEKNTNKEKLPVSANEGVGGDQNGQTPIPPPKQK